MTFNFHTVIKKNAIVTVLFAVSIPSDVTKGEKPLPQILCK